MLILDNVQNLMHSHSMYLRECKIIVYKDTQDGRSVKINRFENTPWMFQNPQFSEYLFACTNEYPNGELHFLCGVLVVLWPAFLVSTSSDCY